jgi:hypothetical protein
MTTSAAEELIEDRMAAFHPPDRPRPRGSGANQFDFGDGLPLPDGSLDFAGSIAVDDDGFIYVADATPDSAVRTLASH